MNERTIDAPEASRLEAERALFPTSGVRCGAHNTAVGGSVDSPHLRGLAVDLTWSADIFSLWELLRKHFLRVCMYSRSKGGHCHGDVWITDRVIWDVVTSDGAFLIDDFLRSYTISLTREAVNQVLEAT
jgi:hypothetical protein